MKYNVQYTKSEPETKGAWNGATWQGVPILDVSNFRPESSSHRPQTHAKILYDDNGIYCIFRVQDRFVRSIQTEYMGSVCTDSCVEIFIQPKPEMGYFNFEINCGGTLLVSYIVDSTRTTDGFKEFTPLPEEDGKMVRIYHSMPTTTHPEIEDPVEWIVECFIPFTLLEKYVGAIRPVIGQRWRANLYKCADNSSHPHWASWAPIDELNFHLPRCFGTIVMGDKE